MAVRNGLGECKHHKYVAIDNWSGAWIPNDASQSAWVSEIFIFLEAFNKFLTIEICFNFYSGNVTIETNFYDAETLITKSVVRIYYV